MFRALLKRQWLDADTNAVLPDTYIPRTNGKDDNGLSVTLADSQTGEGLVRDAKIVANSFKKTYGVASLIIGQVRKIDTRLDVIADPLEELPNHALLTGVPCPDHNPAEAERLAGQLARISTVVL